MDPPVAAEFGAARRSGPLPSGGSAVALPALLSAVPLVFTDVPESCRRPSLMRPFGCSRRTGFLEMAREANGRACCRILRPWCRSVRVGGQYSSCPSSRLLVSSIHAVRVYVGSRHASISVPLQMVAMRARFRAGGPADGNLPRPRKEECSGGFCVRTGHELHVALGAARCTISRNGFTPLHCLFRPRSTIRLTCGVFDVPG